MVSRRLDINNLPPEKLIEGINLIIENAEKLFEVATMLKASKNYGIANSLYILCCEEAIKAFALYNNFLIDDDREISPYFKKHSEKLELLKEGYHFISCETKAMKESFETAIKNLDTTNPEKIEEEAKKLHNDIYEKYLNNISDIENDKKWWKMQNQIKQNGLYVGFENNSWIGPRSFTEDEVKITGEKAINILGHIIQYKDLEINKYKTKK